MRPLIACALLSGCYSADDIRALPVKWTATYQAPYSRLMNCIADQYAGDLTVVPQVFPEERRGNVLLTWPQAGQVMGEYQLRQDANGTEVTFRSKPGLGSDARITRERADRCARS